MYKLLFFFLITTYLSYSNDGAFFVDGNHLVPIKETEISIKKEILTLKKVRNQFIEVTVYYEFYNPSKDKTITVGFEAASPYGDANTHPNNGLHPYMRDFTVEFNNSILNYNVTYVNEPYYTKDGNIKKLDSSKIAEYDETDNSPGIDYVYHFKAKFKTGINVVKHTYSYDLSSSITSYYSFGYILTTAKRWANKQIDDFTLIIDMGEFETFCINKSFFKSKDEWLINGIGKTQNVKANKSQYYYEDIDKLKFHIQKGNLIFQKKNFKIDGDLFLYSQYYWNYNDAGEDIQNFDYIPFSYFHYDKFEYKPESDFDKKVFKNLPFAKRGYIFNEQDLDSYFRKIDWYMPNPNYIPNIETLSEYEQKWIEKWSIESK